MAKKDTTVEDLAQQVGEYKEQLQRVQAEFDNYRKRIEKEQADNAHYAAFDFSKTLLPVLDMMEQALKTSKQADEHTKGLHLIHQSFLKTLETEGIAPMKDVGQLLDPERHEVMLKIASEEAENTILEELQTGYVYKDRVLRHAKVSVSSGKA